MMTDTGGWPDRSKEFILNHVVPILKIESSCKKVTKEWIEVKRKIESIGSPTEDQPGAKKARSRKEASIQSCI